MTDLLIPKSKQDEAAFDPHAFASELRDTEKPTTSKLESGARGFAQGVSLGFSDEITAALESAFTPKTYKESVGEARANNAKAKDDNPWTYGIGEVGGGVAAGLATGGAGAAAKVGLTGVKGAAAIGGALGAASGAGAGEGLDDSFKKALLGGVTGAAIGGTAAKLFSPAVAGARKAAEDQVIQFGVKPPSMAAEAARAALDTVGKGKGVGGAELAASFVGGAPAAAAVKGAKVAGRATMAAGGAVLANLARGAANGNLAKDTVLKAIETGVPVSSTLAILSAWKNRPAWADDVIDGLRSKVSDDSN